MRWNNVSHLTQPSSKQNRSFSGVEERKRGKEGTEGEQGTQKTTARLLGVIFFLNCFHACAGERETKEEQEKNT